MDEYEGWWEKGFGSGVSGIYGDGAGYGRTFNKIRVILLNTLGQTPARDTFTVHTWDNNDVGAFDNGNGGDHVVSSSDPVNFREG